MIARLSPQIGQGLQRRAKIPLPPMARQTADHTPDPGRTAAPGTAARTAAAGTRGFLAYLMLALALGVGLLVHVLEARPAGLRTLETSLRDGVTRMLATRDTRPNQAVVLVDIDENSLRAVGPWPWPRARLADLAEQLLAAHGVKLVVLDVVLPEPAGGEDALGDARLAALGQAGLLVPAQAFDYVRRDQPITTGTPGGALVAQAPDRWPAASGHVANFATLAQARCVGNIGFVPDFDGQVRRLALLTRWQGELYPTLALAAVQCARGDAAARALLEGLHPDARGWWGIPWRSRRFLTVPAGALLDDRTLPTLAGRIALIGSSALGLSDRVATPLAASTAGVTVHAAALDGMLWALDGHAPPAPSGHLLAAWLTLSTLALWWAIARWRRLRAIAAVLGGAITVWAALATWVVHTRAAVAITPALWSYACLLGLFLPIEWSAAQARLRARTRLLSRYLARPVLDELLAGENDDPLLPRHAEISVLIADLQDYTRITANSTLTRPVLEGRGTLDSYTGDGLIAFWGAPIATPDHADQALQAALDIAQAIARLNEARRQRGRFALRVRIGLASGPALVGDLGTPFRSTYTAVGAAVNLASRLQQAARGIDCDILVSGETASAVRKHRLRRLGDVELHGLAAVTVFTPQEAVHGHTPGADDPPRPGPGERQI
jgi:adenylate cyclase